MQQQSIQPEVFHDNKSVHGLNERALAASVLAQALEDLTSKDERIQQDARLFCTAKADTSYGKWRNFWLLVIDLDDHAFMQKAHAILDKHKGSAPTSVSVPEMPVGTQYAIQFH